ncbi:MAG: enolase C-terminal domain-like protein, partial [Chthonomonadales bacterium]
MVIEKITATMREIRLRVAFATAQDAAPRTAARVVRVQSLLQDGRSVLSEAVPAPYVTGETCDTVLADIEAAAPRFIGMDATRLAPMLRVAAAAVPPLHFTARAALEVAAYNTYAAATGTDLWHHFGAAVESVETDITLSRSEDPVAAATKAAAAGFRWLKVKLGSPAKDEVQRLVEVHAAVPSIRLRLDANQAYTAAEALDLVEKLVAAELPIEFLEQPVRWDDIEALGRVAEASPIPIVADEAVKTPADALRLMAETKVQAINIKIMKCGVTGALGILEVVRAFGRRAMIGCM